MPDPHGNYATDAQNDQRAALAGARAPLTKPSSARQSTKEEAADFLRAALLQEQAKVLGLTQEKAALIQEYVLASDEDAPEKLKKQIRGRIPVALEVLDEIMLNGNSSDGTRAGIAKWIVDRGLAPDQLGGLDAEASKLVKLLDELK